MKEFPELLNVKNKDRFQEFHYNRTLLYLRKDIYEHMLKSINENNFYDLDKFNKLHLNNMDDLQKMVQDIMSELKYLGWKSKLSFGNTALFIYSTDNPPSSCWDDGLI